MKRIHLLIVIGIVITATGVHYLLKEPPVVDAPADDTGMTRQETEDMMRQIGYVQ